MNFEAISACQLAKSDYAIFIGPSAEHQSLPSVLRPVTIESLAYRKQYNSFQLEGSIGLAELPHMSFPARSVVPFGQSNSNFHDSTKPISR